MDDSFDHLTLSRPVRVRKSRPSFDETNYEVLPETPTDNRKRRKRSSSKVSLDSKRGDAGSSIRSTQVTAGSSPSSLLSPGQKRPRGRPPLIARKSLPSSSLHGNISNSSIIFPPHNAMPKAISVNEIMEDAPSSSSGGRTSRPPYSWVLDKLVTGLMTSEPLTLQELSKRLGDSPKDMIQSLLDVLQVFGVIIQVKAMPGYRPDVLPGIVLYSLSGFAKGPAGLPLEDVVKDTKEREQRALLAHERLEKLHSLSQQVLGVEERREQLKDLIQQFQQKDPSIGEDPLYKHIYAALIV